MRHGFGISVIIASATLMWLGCAKQTPSSPASRSQPISGAAALDAKISEVERYKMEHTVADTSRAQLSEDLLVFARDFEAIASTSQDERVKERALTAAESMRLTVESLGTDGERADELAWEAQEKWRRAVGP